MFTDKTSNIYKMSTKVAVADKKAPIKIEKAINSEAKCKTVKLQFSDRIAYLAYLVYLAYLAYLAYFVAPWCSGYHYCTTSFN